MAQETSIEVIKQSGRISGAAAAQVKTDIQECLTGGNRNIVVDISDVSFIDSSGLGMLVAALRNVNAKGGDIKIAGASPEVRSLFELTRLDKVFDLYDTIDEAVTGFRE